MALLDIVGNINFYAEHLSLTCPVCEYSGNMGVIKEDHAFGMIAGLAGASLANKAGVNGILAGAAVESIRSDTKSTYVHCPKCKSVLNERKGVTNVFRVGPDYAPPGTVQPLVAGTAGPRNEVAAFEATYGISYQAVADLGARSDEFVTALVRQKRRSGGRAFVWWLISLAGVFGFHRVYLGTFAAWFPVFLMAICGYPASLISPTLGTVLVNIAILCGFVDLFRTVLKVGDANRNMAVRLLEQYQQGGSGPLAEAVKPNMKRWVLVAVAGCFALVIIGGLATSSKVTGQSTKTASEAPKAVAKPVVTNPTPVENPAPAAAAVPAATGFQGFASYDACMAGGSPEQRLTCATAELKREETRMSAEFDRITGNDNDKVTQTQNVQRGWAQSVEIKCGSLTGEAEAVCRVQMTRERADEMAKER